MVRIQSIKIMDERHIFKDFHLDLGDMPQKIVALVGPNGCGKSSVFDFFETYQAQKLGKSNILPKGVYLKSWQALWNTSGSSNIHFKDNLFNGNKTFYIRSPYRHIEELNITTLSSVPDAAEDKDRPTNMRLMDIRLLNNYSRLQGKLFHDFKKGEEGIVEQKFILKFNKHIKNILDIQLHDLGNVLESRGQLYFKRKNSQQEISYNFLSSGEKEVIDIILDLILKVETYDNTVFCIDEPELHINTSTQRMLLREIDKILPDNCQLWIATHSIGFLRGMQEELNSKSQIIDFGEFPYPGTILTPIEKNSASWRKLFHIAIDDLTSLIAPEVLIYCEGNTKKNVERRDASTYNAIFGNTQPHAFFINAGGSSEMEKYGSIALDILKQGIFPNSKLYVLKDKDGRNDNQRKLELEQVENMRMLKRREIENYLFDWNVIQKVYPQINEGDYRNIFKDINLISGDMDSKFGELKDLCGEHNKEIFVKKLAEKINQIDNPEIFNELTEIIFINSSDT